MTQQRLERARQFAQEGATAPRDPRTAPDMVACIVERAEQAVPHGEEAAEVLPHQPRVVDVIPLILLGFPAWAVVASAVIRTWWGYFIHADLPWTLGSVGKVLISPAAHRLHHIDDARLMGQNFGGFFTVWDRLFGTFDDASDHIGCRTGIAAGSRALLGELARPFEAVLRSRKREPAAPAA